MTSDSWRAFPAREEARPAHRTGDFEIDARAAAMRPVGEALGELGVGLGVIDASDDTLILANRALAACVGRAHDEVTGADLLDLVDPEDAETVRARVRDAARGEPTAPFAIRLRHAGKRRVIADASFRRFGDPDAPLVVAVIAPAFDREEARSLRAALGQALDALRSRDDFFALAAHELRTPLTPLVLHLQTTLRAVDRDPHAVRRSLLAAESQVKRIAALVEQLLDVARVRAGRLVLERQTLDLATIVRDAASRFAAECARSGTVLEIESPAPVIGRWDPLRIDQIVSNLVSNAVKYGAGSPVRVTLESDEARALLTVRDRGRGIAPENVARIFDRFERAERDPSVRGVGLGLWIARQLVEAHGGTIEVRSAPGTGSVFVVELPRE